MINQDNCCTDCIRDYPKHCTDCHKPEEFKRPFVKPREPQEGE